MAEDLDVDALLDAPFKPSKVGDGQLASAGADVGVAPNAKPGAARALSPADTRVAGPGLQSRPRSPRDRHRSSRSRHRHDDAMDMSPPHHRRRSRGSRSPLPEHDGSERDLRTVIAMQLSAQLRRSELVDFFGAAGRVRDAQIVSEKGSRRSRGVAYVEFYAAASVAKAVALSGQRLLGVPIIVQPSEAEKNRRSTTKQYTTDGAPMDPLGSVNCLVLVRNLAVDIEPADLARFFELFGTVEHCHVAPAADITDTHDAAGWGAFVKLDAPVPACQAAERLDGLELLGERLRVRMARRSEQDREQRRLSDERAGRRASQSDAAAAAEQQPCAAPEQPAAPTEAAAVTSPMAISPHPDSTPTTADATAATDAATVPVTGTEMHQVLLLRGMVDPSEETEPSWREELEDDVGGECAKYGRVARVFVDRGPSGDIYVNFIDGAAARLAQQSMSGRWFGGHKIVAELVSAEQFQARLAV
ncbi:Phosphatidylinositol-3-phosphatase SAC1 [Coemansia spiralis]|nr:Phosphatidylinositol-3-phosphatase SAC1 [Coemansia spiralis]